MPDNLNTDGTSPTRPGDEEKPRRTPTPFEISQGDSETFLAAPDEVVQFKAGDVIVDQFEVVKELGRGGMGVVYEVRDRLTRQRLALKVILPSILSKPRAVERFVQEVNTARRLRHPGIVAVYDVRQEGPLLFFTMEFLEGQTLREVLNDRGSMSLDETVDILTKLCDALEHAHEFTVHRDVSPENVMILKDGKIKLLDFGIAKAVTPSTFTATQISMGKAYYMSPEQRKDAANVDHRADIFPLGVMFFEMLTGEMPVGYSRVSELNPDVSEACDEFFAKSIAPADKRYASTSESRRGLQVCVGRDADSGTPPSRRRGWAIPVAAVFIMLVVAVGYYAFFGNPLQSTEVAVVPDRGTARPESADTVEEQPKEPQESPGLAVEGSTATETSRAKTAAMQARTVARDAQAQEHANTLFQEAEELFKQGEAHDTLKAFENAVAKYGDAQAKFAQAEKEAKRVSGEIAALSSAKASMDAAKAEADRLDASRWAKTRYEQALEVEEAGSSMSDRVAVATKYDAARELYDLAVSETRQQGEAIVAAARRAAEAARSRAGSAVVRRYAADELESASRLMGQAEQAGADFESAKGLYEEAGAKYGEAASLAARREAAAKVDAESARQRAETARGRIGADERRYAESEVASGDSAWSVAESAGENYTEAARQYGIAEREYAKAVEVTPERKRAAQQPRAGDMRTFSGIEMVWIPSGSFQMGSPSNEEGRYDREGPQHPVTVTKGYWLGKYEVTQAQWKAAMGSNPSQFKGDSLPVERVSWTDCRDYIRKLNSRGEGGFRLPTEAEWEYACRAGTTTAYSFGGRSGGLGDYAWYSSNSRNKTHSVGQKRSNAWGLHDMHGNVWEWCQDWFGEYSGSSLTDPTGPSTGSSRVLRGGSWGGDPGSCRSAYRYGYSPDNRYGSLGFRLAR